MATEAEAARSWFGCAVRAVHTTSVIAALVIAAVLWFFATSTVVLVSFIEGWMTSPAFMLLAGLLALLPNGVGTWIWYQGRRERASALSIAGAVSIVVIICSLPGAALNPYFWLAVGIVGSIVTA